MNGRYECECGSVIMKEGLSQHKKTKKHLQFISQPKSIEQKRDEFRKRFPLMDENTIYFEKETDTYPLTLNEFKEKVYSKLKGQSDWLKWNESLVKVSNVEVDNYEKDIKKTNSARISKKILSEYLRMRYNVCMRMDKISLDRCLVHVYLKYYTEEDTILDYWKGHRLGELEPKLEQARELQMIRVERVCASKKYLSILHPIYSSLLNIKY